MTPQQLEEIKARCEAATRNYGVGARNVAESIAAGEVVPASVLDVLERMRVDAEDRTALLDEVERARSEERRLGGIVAMLTLFGVIERRDGGTFVTQPVADALDNHDARSALSPDGGRESEQTQKETGQ